MTLVAVRVPSVKVVTWMVKPLGCAISWPVSDEPTVFCRVILSPSMT